MLFVSLIALSATAATRSQQSPIGEWTTDKNGLPAFCYTGSVPFKATLSTGDSVKLDPDPWFVLGNYQLTVFAHVSGRYELITGQRAWARLNQGDRINTGMNNARLEIISASGTVSKDYKLVGLGSLAANPSTCQRTFGTGYANYNYSAGKIKVVRSMNVKPSTEYDNGTSAFLLNVTLRNNGRQAQRIRYIEDVRAQYETMMQQGQPREWRKIKYKPRLSVEGSRVEARFAASTDNPMLFESKDDISKWEGFPPVMFMEDLSGKGSPSHNGNDMTYTFEMTLKAGEERTVQLVIGYSMERQYSNIQQILGELRGKTSFGKEWRDVLPCYENEQDSDLRREMTWHAYMLEAMATYSDFYHETKIPQGTIYDYFWGQHASARDNFQHALATIYYNPKLTKSIIRYMMKRTSPTGEIMLIEYGNGYAEPTCYQTSDQQLWFFLLLSEYLRITGDYAFLSEKVECYPVKDMPRYTIMQHALHCFDYLRNQVGTGSHGLVRLLNSDWCDGVYYSVAAPYNVVQPQGESHMNTAMAMAILPVLADQLERGYADKNFVSSIRQWRDMLKDVYMKDWGSRAFPRRMYFAGKTWGDNHLWLEQTGFTLQVEDIPPARRKALYDETAARLYKNEKLGARQQECPELTSDDLDYGSRENGGFWYSLNGPVIVGIATFDKPEALRRLRQMSLANGARQFPQYWSGYWSAADNIESSLVKSEGLPDQTASYAETAIACAHVHAWMLYCYNKINER